MLTAEQSKAIEDVIVDLEREYPDWGQFTKTIEEVGEFTAALGRYFVNPCQENVEQLVEEMCDALLCFSGILVVVRRKFPAVDFNALLLQKIAKARTKHLERLQKERAKRIQKLRKAEEDAEA
jgi:nucleoid-associated protein YejK